MTSEVYREEVHTQSASGFFSQSMSDRGELTKSLSNITTEHQRKLSQAFRDIGSLKSVVDGLESLYELRNVPLTEVDTQGLPDYPFLLVETLTEDIPELLKLFLSDRRLGEIMDSFDCLAKFLKERPEAWQYWEIIFGHESVQKLVDSKEKLITLYRIKPVKMAEVLKKYPQELMTKNLKTLDDRIDFVQLMPSIRRYIILFDRDFLDGSKAVITVLKWLPELADILLFKDKYNYIKFFSKSKQLLGLFDVVPKIAQSLSDPDHKYHTLLLDAINENCRAVLWKLFYVAPLAGETLLQNTKIVDLIKSRRLAESLIGALRLNKGVHSLELLVKIYRGEFPDFFNKVGKEIADGYYWSARAIQEENKLFALANEQFVMQFLKECKGKIVLDNTDYCKEHREQLNDLKRGGSIHIETIISAHPELVYEILSLIDLRTFSQNVTLRFFVQNLFNRSLEARDLLPLMSFTKLFTHGLPGLINANLDLAQNSLLLSRKIIRSLNMPASVQENFNKEQLRMKLEIDRQFTSGEISLISTSPVVVKPTKSIEEALTLNDAEQRRYDSYCRTIDLFAAMSKPEYVFAAQGELIKELQQENIYSLLKMVDQHQKLYELCHDPRMANYWDQVLYDLWRYGNRYSTIGSAFLLAMGELLFREYQVWEHHGHRFALQAAEFLQRAVSKYRSPSALLELHHYYIQTLENTQPDEEINENILPFIKLCAEQYWSYGLVLAVDMCWSLARYFEPGHPDYRKYLVNAHLYMICAQHFEKDEDTLAILKDIPIELRKLVPEFKSFAEAKEYLNKDLLRGYKIGFSAHGYRGLQGNGAFQGVANLSEVTVLQSRDIDDANFRAKALIELLTTYKKQLLQTALTRERQLSTLPPIEPHGKFFARSMNYRKELAKRLRMKGLRLNTLELVKTEDENVVVRRWTT